MSVSTKKLIGTIATLIWMVIYVGIAGMIGVHLATHYPDNWVVKLLYYALAGTLWIIPVGLALPWMYREPVKKL